MRSARMILARLKRAYPQTPTMLVYKNTFQLLLTVMLSAQTTDKQVNKVTPLLFKRFTTPEEVASASVREIGTFIKSVGLWTSKARNIKKACAMLVRDSNSTVPASMNDLIRLPGVGRKTANVVLHAGFQKNEGIAIDTHNQRLAVRLGLTKEKNPKKIERGLMQQIPQKEWGLFSILLVHHGRAICTARNPQCAACILNKLCPSAFTFSRNVKNT